jgi:MFS family permease
MSGVLGTDSYKRYFHNPRSYGQGAITAAMPFGSLVGALSSSFLADKYSRKISIQIASIIWIIGSMYVYIFSFSVALFNMYKASNALLSTSVCWS